MMATQFPVFATAYEKAPEDEPVMLDGMEVIFDRTVGLYPVQATFEPEAPPDANGNGNGHANGTRRANGRKR
jgi:hypothetical protein